MTFKSNQINIVSKHLILFTFKLKTKRLHPALEKIFIDDKTQTHKTVIK